MQPLGKLFGWNDRILRRAAKTMMPSETVAFFGEKTDLLGDYLPSHFKADSVSSRVHRYVHIQAGWTDDKPLDPVGETAWLDGLHNGPDAIVSHADLSLGADVKRVLQAHRSASDRVRGVRHMLSWHPAATVMDFADAEELSRTTEFRIGYDQLAEHDMSFDAWCYSGQLDQVADLAAYNPDVPMVLCHAGTPVGYGGAFGGVGVSAQERARIGDRWRDGISALAEHGHVSCKLSGLLMPVLGFGFESMAKARVDQLVDVLTPIVEHCVDAFGADRCMVASNFPVDRIAVSYNTLMQAMIEITSRYGSDAQHAMFSDNALAFYRI